MKEGLLYEDYDGEFDDIVSVVNKLSFSFPEAKFDFKFNSPNINKFEVLCNNWDVYFNNSKYKTWCKVLRKAFPKLKWYGAYLNF